MPSRIPKLKSLCCTGDYVHGLYGECSDQIDGQSCLILRFATQDVFLYGLVGFCWIESLYA